MARNIGIESKIDSGFLKIDDHEAFVTRERSQNIVNGGIPLVNFASINLSDGSRERTTTLGFDTDMGVLSGMIKSSIKDGHVATAFLKGTIEQPHTPSRMTTFKTLGPLLVGVSLNIDDYEHKQYYRDMFTGMSRATISVGRFGLKRVLGI